MATSEVAIVLTATGAVDVEASLKKVNERLEDTTKTVEKMEAVSRKGGDAWAQYGKSASIQIDELERSITVLRSAGADVSAHEAALGSLRQQVEANSEVGKKYSAVLRDNQDAIRGTVSVQGDFMRQFPELAKNIGIATAALGLMKAQVEAAKKSQDIATGASEAASKQLADYGIEFKGTLNLIELSKRSYTALADVLNGNKTLMEALKESEISLGQSTKATRERAQELENQRRILIAQGVDFIETEQGIRDAYRETIDAAREVTEAQDKLLDTLRGFSVADVVKEIEVMAGAWRKWQADIEGSPALLSAFNEKVDTLKEKVKELGPLLDEEVTAKFEALAEQLPETADAVDPLLEKLRGFKEEEFRKEVEDLVAGFEAMVPALQQSPALLERYIANLAEMVAKAELLGDADVAAELQGIIEKLGPLTEGTEKSTTALAELTKLLDTQQKSIKATRDELSLLVEQQNALKNATDDLTDAKRKLADLERQSGLDAFGLPAEPNVFAELDAQAALADQIAEARNAVADATRRQAEAEEDAGGNADDLADQIQLATEDLEDMEEAAEGTATAIEEMGKAAQKAADEAVDPLTAMAERLADIADNAERAAAAFDSGGGAGNVPGGWGGFGGDGDDGGGDAAGGGGGDDEKRAVARVPIFVVRVPTSGAGGIGAGAGAKGDLDIFGGQIGNPTISVSEGTPVGAAVGAAGGSTSALGEANFSAETMKSREALSPAFMAGIGCRLRLLGGRGGQAGLKVWDCTRTAGGNLGLFAEDGTPFNAQSAFAESSFSQEGDGGGQAPTLRQMRPDALGNTLDRGGISSGQWTHDVGGGGGSTSDKALVFAANAMLEVVSELRHGAGVGQNNIHVAGLD